MSRCFIRKPSFMKIIGAYRSQWKRYLMRIFTFGLYGKKGMGWIKDPKKAFYNWWYYRTSVSIPRLLGYKPSRFSFLVAGILFCVVSILLSPVDVVRTGLVAHSIKSNRKIRFEAYKKSSSNANKSKKNQESNVNAIKKSFVSSQKETNRTHPTTKQVSQPTPKPTEVKKTVTNVKAEDSKKTESFRYTIPLKRYTAVESSIGEIEHEKAPENAVDRLDALKKKHYDFCEKKIKTIIEANLTDKNQISAMYERLMPFLDEKAFLELYGRLNEYVNGFDSELATRFRDKAIK